jgi:hypothetical protein
MDATPNCFYRMAHPMRKAVEFAWWQCVRRYASYSALALCCIGGAATAGERYGQWSLDPQGEGALSFKRFTAMQEPIAELAFVCNQESKYVVVIIAPSPGTFKNQQESIAETNLVDTSPVEPFLHSAQL